MGKVHKFMGWNKKLSPLTLLCYNENLPLVLKMEPLEPSYKKEFICIKDLFKDGHLKSFDQFVEDFNIPGAQFSHFLRKRHAVLCELKKKKGIEMQMSQIEKLLYKKTVSLN